MPQGRFYLGGLNWGAVQADTASPGGENLDGLSLTQNGGSWDPVDDHAGLRPGALAYITKPPDTAAPLLDEFRMIFMVHAKYVLFGTPGSLQFRLQDKTNAVSLATVALGGPLLNSPPLAVIDWESDIDLLDSGNAIIELQYQLTAPSTADFFAASFEQWYWRI